MSVIERLDTRVVLMYHRLGAPRLGSIVAGQYVAPALFRSQLGYLSARGWSCSALGDFTKPQRDAGKKFAVTFDDGYASVYQRAFPSLVERGMTATVYVVAGAIGGYNEWDRAAGDKREPMMTEVQIKEMSEHGFEIGSHTLTHPHLSALGDNDLARELLDSKHKLEDIIGREVVSFSYPYGDFDHRVADAVQAAGYLNAVSTKLGVITSDSGLFEIPRVNVRWNAIGAHLMRKIVRASKESCLRASPSPL